MTRIKPPNSISSSLGVNRPTKKSSFSSAIKNANHNPAGIAGQFVPGGAAIAAAISSGTSTAGMGTAGGSSLPTEINRTAANFRKVAMELEQLAQQLGRKGHPPSASEKQAACRKLQLAQQTVSSSQVTLGQSINALEDD